jgi:uncharacterized protein YwqG
MSTLQEIFSSAGLSRVSKELIQVALPSIRLTVHSVEETSLRLGSTKFGDSPDLPKGTEWPEHNGSPLPFVAQINVFEIAPYDKDHLFPDAGIMFFFFDQKAFFESRSFDQTTTWYVYYTASPLANLQRFPMPESISRRGRYRTSGVTCSTEITLPDYSKYAPTSIKRLGLSNPLTDREEQAYYQVQAQFAKRAGATYHIALHRLLGHPDNVQWDMYDELGGVPAGWQLLLQVDSDRIIDTNWGDTGRIYYWIRTQNLAERDFSQVKVILQST